MPNSNPDYAEIILDGMHFLLDGQLSVSAVDRFPGKVTIGDYSLDSNDLLSAWVISDLTGGHGVAELKEDVDTNRYRFGTLYTRYPGQITRPFQTVAQTSTSLDVYHIGEMYDSTNAVYDYYWVDDYAIATGLGTSNLFRNGTDTTVNTTSVPTQKGVAYIGAGATRLLYIPQGTNGYSTYNRGANTITNVTGAEKTVAFCVWDDKLITIDTSGQLYYATTAAATTTFTSYGVGGKLDTAYIPKSLYIYYNRAGEPSIYVVTDSGVWIFDPSTPRLYRIPLLESQHPKFGTAACVWRENFYVSAGMDLLEFNGNVIRNIGLSRDDGLPFAQQGWIVDLIGTQNSLYALVIGLGSTLDLPNTTISVHEYSGFGWTCISTKGGLGNIIVMPFMMMSRRSNGYKLFFADGNLKIYSIQLPVTFTNPREDLANSGSFKYGYNDSGVAATAYTGTDWYLETGRFDGNMRGYQKIAAQVTMRVRAITATQTIVVKYRINEATSYTTLGTVTATGVTVLQFGTADANGIYPGIAFDVIEFRIEYTGTSADEDGTQVMEHMTFSFLKVMNPSLSWTAKVNLQKAHNEQSPANMLAKLTTLRTQGAFFTMIHRGTAYRARLAGMSGGEELGLAETRDLYQLSIIEIPSKLGAPV